MKLQTKVPVTPGASPIGYDSRIILLGSCFATNIANKLAYFKFRHIQNPLGILYHPQAITNLISRAIQREHFTGEEVFFLNERWHSFDAHSDMSSKTSGELLGNLNRGLDLLGQELQRGTHLIVSLGTSWAYHLKSTGTPVANCHKVPQAKFDKKLYTSAEVTEQLNTIINLVKSVNAHIHCIFTISPVRHLKDGFTGNLRSKSNLISALQQVVEEKKEAAGIHYFPAYEIMMDELRDYRFYEPDLVHPNATAIQYIWELFKKASVSNAALPVMEMVAAIQKGLEHKPFDKESKSYTEFRQSLEEKIDYIKGQYDFITFES
jgi:lysophospholipase L1-like esterase